MKRVSEKNVKAILGKDYGGFLGHLQDGVWTNSFKVVKDENSDDWILCCNARSGVDNRWDITFIRIGKRLELVKLKRQLEAAFVRQFHLVKKDLDDGWSKQVQERDGEKCFLCGSTEKCSAHHWYVNANRSRMARWHVVNGIWLCYGCHIRIAHERPDYRTYRSFYEHVRSMYCKTDVEANLFVGRLKFKQVIKELDNLSELPVTDERVRKLWVKFCAP